MEAAIGVETLNAFLAIAFLAVLFMFSSSIRRHRRRKMADGCNCYPELEDKPQNRFKRVLADNSYSPFKHFKREGKEKEISLRIHPFAREIDYLLKHPPDLKTFITSHRNPNSSCHFVWIDTEDQLEALANILNEEEIFAVDTEQHSIRSFLGFTSLIQISTWKEDYLIDTIALHDMMATLRPAFANPAIIKVFHGADNDVLWLQRDFHIYVVNMFDTAKACEILSKPQKSLAYLLETYCGVYTDKTLQREDWRLRPLSDEMTEYARNDAHYLLYIAGCLASELESKTSAHSAAEKYKKQVAQEFGIPLFVQKIVNSGESTAATVASTSMSADEETGVSPLQLRTAAMALLRHGSNMPSGRLEELMQIVRTYFGRQEVSVEDLEAALLVGMSPHERRRFEKKRGLSFRHTEQNVVYKNHISSSSQINNHNKEKDKESINDQRIHSNLSPVDTNGNLLLETFGSSSIQILNREVEIEQGNASYLKMDIENEDQLDDSSVNLLLMPDEITSSETAKKMSLLGHGPHGKQVVEHLLRRYREEGVRQFCQRWRKVFVDAIHPRFLPLGWDIMHSGRRDFGDYSVYNPAKKALPETNMVD